MIEPMVQFSIFLGNKPAMLAKVCRELAEAKINIVALAMMDSSEHGVLRLVAKDAERTRDTLKRMNLSTTEAKVLAVTMPNRPGACADVCERLSHHRVPISYMYTTTGAAGGKAIGIFKVHDMSKAEKVLKARDSGTRDLKLKLRNAQRTRAALRA